MIPDLSARIVLLSGAGWPPGRSIALALAAQGARLLLSDLTPVNLDGIADEIRAQGGLAEIYTADISSKIPAQTMITGAVEKWGRIDTLINIIGVQPRAPLLDLDEWDWRRALDVNLTGSFLMTQIVGRVMREIGGGDILFVADYAASSRTNESRAAFAAGKSGLVGLTHAAARELAGHRIRVNALFREPDGDDFPTAPPAPEAAALLSGVESLAAAVLRLCSAEAAGISGQVLVIR